MRNPHGLVPGWNPILALGRPVLISVGALIGDYFYSDTSSSAVGAPSLAVPLEAGFNLPPGTSLQVDVAGAVVHPGLYRVSRGDRVGAASAAAGGLTAGADATRLPNLAGRLKDGEQTRFHWPAPRLVRP